jgi:hypothetical protein
MAVSTFIMFGIKNVRRIVVRMIVCVKRNHMAISTFIMFGIKNVVVLTRR